MDIKDKLITTSQAKEALGSTQSGSDAEGVGSKLVKLSQLKRLSDSTKSGSASDWVFLDTGSGDLPQWSSQQSEIVPYAPPLTVYYRFEIDIPDDYDAIEMIMTYGGKCNIGIISSIQFDDIYDGNGCVGDIGTFDSYSGAFAYLGPYLQKHLIIKVAEGDLYYRFFNIPEQLKS